MNAFLGKNILLILILILGAFLRINCDTFIQGYQFDELAMSAIAALKFPFEILKNAALLDYHAPLYYLIAHFFTYFHNESTLLRIFNVFLSLINIFVFYKIGCNIKNKSTGLVLALLFAINHLQISCCPFVKFYVLCFLICSICFLFFIKSLKKDKYLIPLAISNAFFIFSSTLGVIFVVFEYFVLFFIKNNKKAVLFSFLYSMIGFILYFPVLFIQTKIALANIISPHANYSTLTLSALFYFLNDYFTPLLNYACVVDTVPSGSLLWEFLYSLQDKKIDYISLYSFLFFSLFPVVISLSVSVCAIYKNKFLKILFLPCFLYFTIFILLVKLEILGMIPLYAYVFGFFCLIASGAGICYIKNTKIKVILLLFIVVPQLLITNCYPQDKRSEDKLKIFNCVEKYIQDVNDDTILIATVGGRFLAKRYKNVFNFDYEQAGASHNKTLAGLIYGADIIAHADKKNIRGLIAPFILQKKKNPAFEEYINKELINKLHKKQKVVYFFNADNAPFLLSDDYIKKVLTSKNFSCHLTNPDKFIQNEENINLYDVFEAIQTYSSKQLIQILDKNLKRVKIEQYTPRQYGNYIRTFESSDFKKSTLWIAQNALNGWVFITYEKQ